MTGNSSRSVDKGCVCDSGGILFFFSLLLFRIFGSILEEHY